MDIKKSLSHPVSSSICFLISLLARIGMQRIFVDIAADKFALVLLTRNFLHGHGLNLEAANLSDLSQKIYVPFNGWPPAYNLLLAPFLSIMEDNFMLAAFLADIAVTIVFFIYLRKLLLLINFPVWLINLFLLFQAFFIHPYTVTSNPTDYAGMTFLLAGIYHMVKFTSSSGSGGKQLAGFIFFLCAAAFTRYQYVPVVILMGLFLAIQGRIYKNKQWAKAGLIAAGVSLITIMALLIYQKMTAGQYAFMTPANTGFYPENWLKTYPFIPRSFVNLHFYATQLAIKLNTAYSFWIDMAKWPNALLLIFFLGLAVVWFTKKTTIQKPDAGFRVFGGMAAFLTTGVLFGLALIQSTENIPPLLGWTYVQDERYFSFPALFVQVIAWQWLFAENGSSLVRKIFRWLLIVITVFEMLHGIYFIAKKFSAPMAPIHEVPRTFPLIDFTRKFVEEETQKNNRHVVVAGFGKMFGFTAGWYGGASMLTPFKLNDTMPKSSEPAVLLVPLREVERPYMQSFLQQPGVKLLHKVDHYYFYVLYVEP